ncbi:MAG: response regulator transcription factor [Flavobacteriaceae bacterium]|nr:response regulator transcription factor [Flavobacteriaceae bacterium]
MRKEDIKILLVDDELDILEIVSYNLKNEGFQVFTAINGKKAIQKAIKIKPHLIILDIMMPELDGIETCTKIREIDSLQDVIITFFTARSEDYSQIAGFEAGADDYITKPVKPKILISKVKALLRRYLIKETITSLLNVGDLVIDRESYFVLKDKKRIILPRKEFELLYFLASNVNKVVKRQDIMNNVWGTEVVVGDRTIDVHIRKLRKKIGNDYFITIKGVGYKFETIK